MNRISRRSLFAAGGSTVGLAAVLAACRGDDGGSSEDSRRPRRPRGDIALLRTASSIEHVGLVAYGLAIESRLVETRAVRQLLRLFRSHHRDHAALFVGATRDLNGKVYDEPNPAVLEQLKSPIDAMVDEPSVLALALSFEAIAAQTYQSFVNEFRDQKLSFSTVSVGGSEARHMAALLTLLGETAAPNVLQTTERAVASGTGI